jgi:hypothetical protein
MTTNEVAVISDADAEVRWRDWQARGAADDRRTATRMRWLVLFLATGLLVWSVAHLA